MIKSRRKARIVGQSEAEDAATTQGDLAQTEEAAVKRAASKPKHKSTRLSFGVGESSMLDDEPTTEVFTPKKSNLSRQAIEKNALRKSGLSTAARPPLEDRPSYTKDLLTELKNSTPSTPKDLRGLSPNPESKVLDIAAKFGSELSAWQRRDGGSLIPTEAEIQEKKLRRARLAAEKKYNITASDQDGDSDHDDDDDFHINHTHDSDEDEFKTQHDRVALAARSKSKYAETRLVRDDENLMEEFDEFVEDGGGGGGKVMLGRKAEKAAKLKQRSEMRELIERAEGVGGSDDGSDDDSERERLEAYEAAQTRKGMEGLRVEERPQERSRTPPRITPLPTLAGCLEKMQAVIARLEYGRSQQLQKMEDIVREKQDIEVQEKHIQALLQETAARYEKLCADAGMNTNGFASAVGQKLLDSANAASAMAGNG